MKPRLGGPGRRGRGCARDREIGGVGAARSLVPRAPLLSSLSESSGPAAGPSQAAAGPSQSVAGPSHRQSTAKLFAQKLARVKKARSSKRNARQARTFQIEHQAMHAKEQVSHFLMPDAPAQIENENSNNNDEARGLARGGRGVARGSMAARSVRGVRTRGGQRGGGLHKRPSVSVGVFCGMLEDLPKAKTSQTEIHPKRVRVLPIPVGKNLRSETLWSSLDMIAPSTTSTSRGRETPPPMPAAPLSLSNMVPSSALLSLGVGNRQSSSDYEISAILKYGSEEESGDEEEGITQSVVMPRVARMFMDEEDEEVKESCVIISLEWPPQLPRPSISASTPASPSPTSLSPASPSPASPSPASPSPASPSPPSPLPVTPTPMEPNNKFHFIWRAFSMPQTAPHLRREPFSQIISGPKVSFTNPYEAFTAIWDREIMELIVRETNIYAQQLTMTMLEQASICPWSRITRWQDTNVNELYTYLAIVLAMGVVVKSRLEEYWNAPKDIFSTPGFSSEMSFNRFCLLSKCLHFNNNRNCDSALLTRAQAKLVKVQPIINHLNGKFSQVYNLSQNVSLDESLTMWKGRLDINQFIRNKAATVGIKTYEVCESQTGYLWRFEVHAGHDTSALQEDDPVTGTVPDLVLRLLNGLEHKGHTIWMDNFYNSPAVARELKVRGFDCVGTLQTNRQFVPSELASIRKEDMIVGQVLGCTSGDVDLMVWRDKNRVAFISTYHGLATSRCGDTLKPTVVQDYNICMGGVDRKDQQLAMYPTERTRTRVWYKKFFRRLLNASVLNSYILLKNQSLTHRKFRKALITDLLTAHRTPAPTPTTPKAVVHSPAQYELMMCGNSVRRRRLCAVCKRRTNSYCKACDVAMCVYTCYEPYHTSH